MSSHDSGGAPFEYAPTPTTRSNRRAAHAPNTKEGEEVQKMPISFVFTAERGNKRGRTESAKFV